MTDDRRGGRAARAATGAWPRGRRMSAVQESPRTAKPAEEELGTPARAAPLGAHRVLLPDARLAVRGRGRRPGDAAPRVARPRPVRGPLGAALLALPDRDERLLRHARRPRAPRAADGSRPGAGAPVGQPEHAAGGRVDRADPDGRVRAGGRPCRRGGRPRVDPARVRRGAAASAAAPACGADPVRGAALEGRGGRRAARHERRLGQQRPAAGARDARGRATSSATGEGRPLDEADRELLRATSTRSRRTTWTR